MALKANRLVSINSKTVYSYKMFDLPGSNKHLKNSSNCEQPRWNSEDSEEEMTDLQAELSVSSDDDHNQPQNKDKDEYFLEQEDYDDVQNRDACLSIEMGDSITAIELSENGQFLLANVSMTHPRIELWDLESGECQRKFRGHIQSKFVLKPAFGGIDERLVLCGSEDTNICVWYRQSGELVAKLAGHFQIINAVSWHPNSPILFASASDDTQIKLWSVP